MNMFSFMKRENKTKNKLDYANIAYPFLIKSSAGTGKTESIANIVINLIKEHTAYLQSIAIITFTNKATIEMIDRIQHKLELLVLDTNDDKFKTNIYLSNIANISTIHSFCEHIIREFGLEFGISPDFKISYNKSNISSIVSSVIKENFNNEIYQCVSNYKLKELIIKSLNDNENKGIEHLEYNSNLTDEFWKNFDKYFIDLYNTCYDLIEEDRLLNNYLTPNDLIKYAVKLTSKDTIAQCIANDIKYLFIDEFQDTNIHQYQLVKNLQNYINIILVGDEKQSIYKFRGSDLNSYLEMTNNINSFGENHIFTSNVNYRSDSGYIKALNKIFNSKFSYKGMKLEFNNTELIPNKKTKSEEYPIVVEYEHQKYLPEIIKNLSQNIDYTKNDCYNDIVILCRNNNEVSEIEWILEDFNLPYTTISGKTLLQEHIVKDTLKIFEFLMFGSDIYRYEIQQTIYCEKFCNGKNLTNEFISTIEELKPKFINTSPANFIEILKNKCFMSTNDVSNKKNLRTLSKLKQIARDYNNHIDFYNYLSQKADNQNDDIAVSGNGIIISTIHKFKGLTADYVIIYKADDNLLNLKQPQYLIADKNIYFNDMILDNRTKIKSDETYKKIYRKDFKECLEEELRVMYVALTRAKHKTVLYCKKTASKIDWLSKQNYISYISLLNL